MVNRVEPSGDVINKPMLLPSDNYPFNVRVEYMTHAGHFITYHQMSERVTESFITLTADVSADDRGFCMTSKCSTV